MRQCPRMAHLLPFCCALFLAACDKLDRKAPAHAATTWTVRVRIVDADGRPVTDTAGVWWTKLGQNYGTRVGAIDGVAVLKEIPAEPFRIVALPDGFPVGSEGWPSLVVRAETDEVTIVLDVGERRTLRVVGRTPEADDLVCLAATTDLEPSHHGIEDDDTIRLEGLREGVHYNLYVREYETNRCALLRSLAQDEPWPVVELAAGTTITGTIRLPEGCETCNVAVMVDKAAMMDGIRQDDGTFSIPSVPHGRWTVVAYTTHEGHYLARTARVEAGSSIDIDLRGAK